MSNHAFKADAVLQAIRAADVGSDVIIHNEDGSVFCILTVKVKEHPEHNRIGQRCSVHTWDKQGLWCLMCGHQRRK